MTSRSLLSFGCEQCGKRSFLCHRFPTRCSVHIHLWCLTPYESSQRNVSRSSTISSGRLLRFPWTSPITHEGRERRDKHPADDSESRIIKFQHRTRIFPFIINSPSFCVPFARSTVAIWKFTHWSETEKLHVVVRCHRVELREWAKRNYSFYTHGAGFCAQASRTTTSNNKTKPASTEKRRKNINKWKQGRWPSIGRNNNVKSNKNPSACCCWSDSFFFRGHTRLCVQTQRNFPRKYRAVVNPFLLFSFGAKANKLRCSCLSFQLFELRPPAVSWVHYLLHFFTNEKTRTSSSYGSFLVRCVKKRKNILA